ncbi:GAK system ATP-grasp enzyme [Desulfovibrio oxamicus]|uniref:GAK system ATP-grasp enzyme n=1 Tax=Nitratidesulfovibrio oxamicus TaxID=32016 RepID=A0ABS0J342_9BACT|nr:GAK system ATP-grasp enzyme [Nitratidesulfovibrio oxamicus]MBG3876855.1 GAK system ATP-grasp enzyme [Nitratidesulfovibrio oxamicus]
MRIGVVGTKGGWSSELLADTVGRATGHRLLIEMDKVRLDLPSGRCLYEDTDLSTLDALIIKKIGAWYSPDLLDRLEMLRLLNERGLPVFSAPLRVLRVLDRLSCTITLQSGSIPMPPTTITEDVDHAAEAVRDYGRAVFKPLYSTKARGMTILEDGPGLRDKITAYKAEHSILYIQKTIELEGGQDLGVVFLGGRYLTTYARCRTNGSWNTTTVNGGKYAAFEPPAEVIAMAQRAQALFGLDFTCVDVALTASGPYVFEVSAFGGFRGILETSGLDAAQLLLEHVQCCLAGTARSGGCGSAPTIMPAISPTSMEPAA